MDVTERNQMIDAYRRGVTEVEDALAGATDRELDTVPPGGWSARMVVHHLADSETNSYLRLRKLLAEDDPQIQGYDEAEFARVLHYDRPIERSLEVFRAVRASSAELLDLATDEDWERTGTHTESGAYSMQDWLGIYVDHGQTHAHQIMRARQGQA